MEQLDSQPAAAEVQVDTALLDRIDEIVGPGTTINPTDADGRTPRWRRRPGADDALL